MHDVIWDRRALSELEAAALWYDEQSPGMGDALLADVQEMLRKIRKDPQIFPKIHPNIRHAVLRRFPYVVLFESEMSFIGIVSIFHSKRNPYEWMKRV